MCEPAVVRVVAHPAVSKAAVVFAVVAGSGVALRAAVGGSTFTAWMMLGLTAYSAIATIALIALRARPTVKAAAPPPPPPQRAPVRMIESRPAPAIEAADTIPDSATVHTDTPYSA